MADEDKVTGEEGTTLQTTNYAVLGSMPDGDIVALAFLVLMQAAKSAQEDVRSVMASVKAINKAKARTKSACGKRELAAVAAFVIASALRPAAILAAPDYSLSAAHELGRKRTFAVH